MYSFALQFNRILCVFIVLMNWMCGCTISFLSSPGIEYCHYNASECHDASNAALTFVCTSSNSINTNDRPFDVWLACKSQYGFGKKPIDIINFRLCKFDKLRDDLFKTYPTVHTLNATKVGLKSLQPTNFWHSNKLTTIILSHNMIREITANLFHESIGIVYIDLSYNFIGSIEPNAFQHGNRVEYLNLSFNQIVELKPELMHRFQQLKYLNLAGNRLVKIESDSFLHCANLIEIDLSNNAISSFGGADVFPLENRVEILNLSSNNISKLAANSFQPLRNLKLLLLSNNKIQKMSSLVLKTRTIVNQIDFSFNQIQRIDFEVNVDQLNLSHNRITAAGVIKKMFNNLVNLTHLNVSSNQITSLPPNSFQNAQKLRHLDLSNNLIREISIQAFANLVNLEHLNLARNRLTKIETGTFSALRHLKTLDISNNALKMINVNILPLQPNRMELLCIDPNLVELTGFYSVIEIVDVGCQMIEAKITDLIPNDGEKQSKCLDSNHSDKNGYQLGMQVFLVCAIVFGINVMIFAWLNSRKINATNDSRTIWWFLVALKKNTMRQSESCRYCNIHCVNLPNDGFY